MALGDIQGRARTSIRNPSAKGECDRCGTWRQLNALQRQFEWRGTSLADTGYLVCAPCLDVPFEQNRTLILPPDPIPRVNPRPSHDITPIAYIGGPLPTSPSTQGFTQYVINAAVPGAYPTAKPAVLSAIASLSGIATPAGVVDRSTVVDPANASVPLMAPNSTRNWLLLYNPSGPQVQVTLGLTATWGSITNLIMGPGEAYFWADAQGLGTTYGGAISIIGLYPGMAFFAWDVAEGQLLLQDGGGLLLQTGGGLLLE